MKALLKFNWKASCALLLCLLGMLPIKAQEPAFRHFSVSEGLSTSEVYGIFQDRDGYIWLATEFGASRYDGYQFQHFSTDDGLSDNTVFEMYQDTKGRIWFHTFNGVPCYYYQGKFVNFLGHENVTEGELTTSILETSDSMVWVSTKSRNIMGITPEDSCFFLSIEYNQLGFIFPVHFINKALAKDSEEEFMVSTTGIFKYDPAARNFEEVEMGCVMGMANPHFTAVDTNYFWVSKMENIFRYSWDGADWKINLEVSVPSKEYLTGLYLDSKRRLWAGTYKGVFVWENGKWTDGMLEEYSVSDILEDSEGNFWFTTLKNGVFMAPSLEMRGWTRGNGSETERLTALAWDEKKRNLWLGNSKGRMTLKEGLQFSLKSDFASMEHRSPEIGDIQCKNDSIILGTNSGLVYMDLEGNELDRVFTFGAVKCLYMDSEEVVWACITTGVYALTPSVLRTYDSLAFISDTERATFMAGTDSKPLRKGRTTTMLEDRNGDYWFGTLDGLERLRIENGVPITERVSDLKFLVESILQDGDGGVWVASHGGGLLHFKDDSLTYLTRENGLGSNLCKKLALNGEHGVWVCSNKGVTSVIAPTEPGTEYEIQHYSDLDGLISSEVNDLLVVQDTLWMATNNGLGFLPLGGRKEKGAPPVIVLDSLVVNGKARNTNSELTFYPSENNLSVYFTGISYRSNGNIEYGYRLNGEPASWRLTSNRKVDFLSLSPGDYNFEVWAQDYRGNRSSATAQFSFSILKPWYARWWAIGIGVFAIAGAFWLGFRRRVKNLEFQQKLRNNAAEADQRALRARITPHFVFNALNSLQALIADNRRVDALKYTSRFSRLMRRIFEQSVENYILLTEELETLELYLQIEQMRFKDRFTYEIKVNTEDPGSLMIPSMLLQPIVENSIWHGLLHQDSPGEILVEVSTKNDQLLCVIQDNGIGRSASKEFQSRFSEQSKSSGLKVTQGRVKTLSKLNNIDLQLKIIDLFGEDGTAEGTRVEFTLPFLTTTNLNEQ